MVCGVQHFRHFPKWRRKDAGRVGRKAGARVSSRHTPSGQLVSMAGLLARGSLRHPPSQPCRPVAFRMELAAHSCGGSHGLDPDRPHRVPFSPLALRFGDHDVTIVGSPAASRNGLPRNLVTVRSDLPEKMHFRLICNNVTYSWRRRFCQPPSPAVATNIGEFSETVRVSNMGTASRRLKSSSGVERQDFLVHLLSVSALRADQPSPP